MAGRRAQPLFTFRLVPLVGELCRERGLDPRPLVRAAGLSEGALRGGEVTAPIGRFRSLLAAAAEALEDDAFGLTLAARVPDGTYSLLEFGARSARTLREALESLSRYGRLVNAITVFRFEEDEQGGRFEHAVLAPGPHRELHELTLARVLGIARAQVGRRIVPERAWFPYPKPRGASRLVAEFGPRLEFGREACGFELSRPVLDLELAGADAALKRWLDAHAEEALARLPVASDLAGRVRALLSAGLTRGLSDLRELAAQLKMSERTLQRRLADEGTSFAQVLEQLRRELARRYLSDPRLSVGEIAWLLGYSELRAFDRAFSRWAGKTPLAWRKSGATTL